MQRHCAIRLRADKRNTNGFSLPCNPGTVRAIIHVPPAPHKLWADYFTVLTMHARNISVYGAVCFLLLACGCAPRMDSVKKDIELSALIESHRKQNTAVQASQNKHSETGIKKLEVVKNKSGEGFAVSADIRGEQAAKVVNALIDAAGINFVFNNIAIEGYSSARFENRSLIDAFNIVLYPLGIECSLRDNIYFLSYAAPTISVDYHLRYLNTEAAMQILEGLYPRSPASQVTYARHSGSDTIFVQGPPSLVSRIIDILKKADRKPAHVLIEALVVECDSEALEKIGADLYNFSLGHITAGSISFKPDGNRAIMFTKSALSTHPAVFQAAIDLLISQSRARMISRPYLSTMSGEKASLYITNDRHVIVQTNDGGGGTVSTATPVSSGVMLEITPTVSAEDLVRMEISVEDSGFVPSQETVAVEVDKNRVKTVMQVDSGKSIIVGGLVLNRRSTTNAGLPSLRNVPLLNLLLANQTDTIVKKEVLIFITPYIWTPDMATPMQSPDAFGIKKEDDGINTSFESSGGK